MSLAQRYQPLVFSEVRGQNHAVATLQAQVRQGVSTPLLLSGPPGTGKTTLARVVSRTLNCDAPGIDGSPCLACENCLAFDTSDRAWFFVEVNAGLHGQRADAKYIEEVARIRPFGGARRRVVFLDEAHALSPAACDALLKLLETPGVAAIVLATSAPHHLPKALRSRCIRVVLEPLDVATLIALGREVCAAEHVRYEPDALAVLAASANGQARDLLMSLDDLSAQGDISIPAVRMVVDVSGAESALSALCHLLRGETPDAVAALRQWRSPASEKACGLRDAFAFVLQRHTGGASLGADRLARFLCVASVRVDELWSAVTGRAQALAVSPVACAVAWGQHWSKAAPAINDDVDFDLHMFNFAHLVAPHDAPLPAAPAVLIAPPPPPVTKRRRALRAPPPANPPAWYIPGGVYLTKDEVRAEHRAATMLPQAFGRWFNARLDLRYGRYGVTDWDASAQLFSTLTHELGLRVRDWCGDPDFRLHWLCQHEVDPEGGYRTWLLVHLPMALTPRGRDWVAEHLPLPDGALVNELGDDLWRAPTNARPHELHWSLVRELWRALDPLILELDERGRRQPLKDLLGVPSQGPRSAGPLPAHKRRYSSSASLGLGAWRAADKERFGFMSVFDERAWAALDRGWELQEHDYRVEEARRRAAERAKLEASMPPGVSDVYDATRAERLKAFFENLPTDPIKRPRSAPLW